eukprot:805799-Prymnesium_polylepis.1
MPVTDCISMRVEINRTAERVEIVPYLRKAGRETRLNERLVACSDLSLKLVELTYRIPVAPGAQPQTFTFRLPLRPC